MSEHGQGKKDDRLNSKELFKREKELYDEKFNAVFNHTNLINEIKSLQRTLNGDIPPKESTKATEEKRVKDDTISEEEEKYAGDPPREEMGDVNYIDLADYDVEKARDFIKSKSASSLDVYRPSEELDKLAENIDGHLGEFLDEALKEYQEKTSARKEWSNKIWIFTVGLVIGTFVLLIVNYILSNIWWSKPIVTEKLLYVFVGGMFAQIISLMLIVMKYVFSPSKDVYSYLTELVKVRKLKNGYGESAENDNNAN